MRADRGRHQTRGCLSFYTGIRGVGLRRRGPPSLQSFCQLPDKKDLSVWPALFGSCRLFGRGAEEGTGSYCLVAPAGDDGLRCLIGRGS